MDHDDLLLPISDEWLVSILGPKKEFRIGNGFSIEFYATMTPSLICEWGAKHDYEHCYHEVSLPMPENRLAVWELLHLLGWKEPECQTPSS